MSPAERLRTFSLAVGGQGLHVEGADRRRWRPPLPSPPRSTIAAAGSPPLAGALAAAHAAVGGGAAGAAAAVSSYIQGGAAKGGRPGAAEALAEKEQAISELREMNEVCARAHAPGGGWPGAGGVQGGGSCAAPGT